MQQDRVSYLRGILIPFLLLGISATSLLGQGGDRGTFSIKRNGRETGHEEFEIRPGKPGRPVGDSLLSAARYPESRPQAVIEAVLQTSPEGDPLTLTLDMTRRQQSMQLIATVGRGRVTIRTVGQGAESARELAGGNPVVMLDDSLYALYLPLARYATERGQTVVAVYPRASRRVQITATRTALSTPGDTGATTVVDLTGGVTGSLYLDAKGRLLEVDFPTLGVEVTRLAE
jgi:hypothetical protein